MSETYRPSRKSRSDEELSHLADALIEYWHAPEASDVRETYAEGTDLYELEYHDPENLWKLIRLIHQKDQSNTIQEVLSAGPVENLLSLHGELFIDRVEALALTDPSFAKLLGGVWQNRMSDAIWNRLQAVWDRRGWDGIPE